ncbi:pleiotropic drug resistance protein TUR2-like [Setaria viridis]|uniref:pleiotropic drug resistance protein TUR2-like n=1 Tax=Setaria viridis TaxID=4556 RepID=UPI003B3A4179
MRKFFAYALVEGQDPFLEYVMQILDLKKIENCLVSGISDTDRDKLSIAELAVGTYSVMVYDQPLTGSDPAMTYDLVNTIRTVCRIQQSSAVMALNHLSQEAFDLFDRIILLGEGHVLYQGPRQDAVTYFAQLGYMKPPHVESWEFLQDIAAENGLQYLLRRSNPRGLEELVECYYSSDHYLDVIRIIGKSKEFSTYWVESEPGIGLSLKESTTFKSNKTKHQETEVVVAKLLNKSGSTSGIESSGNIQVGDVVTGISINEEPLQYLACILGLFAGTLFYKLGGQYNLQHMNSVRALGFHTVLDCYLHAGLIVSIFLLFSGFVIYPSNIPQYWRWLMQINPIRWANISFCNQQFSNGYKDSCIKYPNQLTFCKGNPAMTSGEAYLIYAELFTSVSGKPYVPYIILIGWTLLALLMALVFLNKIDFSQISQSVPQINERKFSKNYLYDVEVYSRSLDGYMEDSTESGRYKSQEPPKLATSSTIVISEGENGSVGSWREEFRVEVESEHLTIPVKPITLTFLDLSFFRCGKVTKEEAIDFENISGYAKPGTMLALVGGADGSAATLLKCLSGRKPPGGSFTGDILVNSTKPSADFSRSVGYAEQLDAHQPYLTIRESLQFSASLRLTNVISKTRRHIHVELVLDQLGLQYYGNHLVGSLRDGTGKTFEVAKKLTIAVELAANPSILFLEEPISGLDSSGTSAILSILSQLPVSGQTVIATVSHPNTRALSYFHQAIILTQEGRQAYFGPVGLNCHEILGYFTAIPRVPPYIQTQNPISFVMGVTGLGIQRRRTAVIDFAEEFQNSHLHEVAMKVVNTAMKNKKFGKEKDSNMISISYNYPASFIRQIGLVLLRTQRFLWRNVNYTYSRFTGCAMIGLLMGSLYFKIKYEDTYGVTSRSLYIYMQTILIGVISANNVIPQIGTDRLAYFREMRSKMYLPISYPVSWVISEIPYFLVATLAFVGIGNGMAGIATETATDFLAYWSVLFLFTLCMTYFGMMVTFIAPSPILAAFLVSIITSLWVSASGVVVLFSDIRFYRWMYWTNPFQYAMSTLTTISFYCDTSQCQRQCSCPRLPDGSYVWDRIASIRSLSQERTCTDVVTLAGMCTTFAVLAFLFFIVLKHNSSHAH